MSGDASMPGTAAQRFGAILRRLIDSRQWDRALEIAREWLAEEPENPEPHLAAAQALINLSQYPAAEVHAKKVLALRPNNAFALRLASIACFRQDKMDEAQKHIGRAIELQPGDPMHWYQLALMRYQQGLLDAAEKYAKRALELEPGNANTINLVALCHRGNPQGQRDQYLRALEIDPENSAVHTNLGAYYMNSERNYEAAEASFRRALQSNPMNDLAQRNLFAVLRLRDPVYRVLTLPRTLLYGASWSRRDRRGLVRIALLLLWISAGRYFLMVFAVWLMLVWPLVKAYEYLTLSDIRARAGVIGARHGGWKGFHRWPLPARLGIFGLLMLCFWGGLYWMYETGAMPGGLIITVVILTLLVWYGVIFCRWLKRNRRRAAAVRAEKSFQRQSVARDPF